VSTDVNADDASLATASTVRVASTTMAVEVKNNGSYVAVTAGTLVATTTLKVGLDGVDVSQAASEINKTIMANFQNIINLMYNFNPSSTPRFDLTKPAAEPLQDKYIE
jgi:hypothetical protein